MARPLLEVHSPQYHTLITAHAHIVHSSRVVDGPPLRPHLAASPPPRPSASSYFYNCNTLHTKELEYTALLLSIELTSHKSQDAEHRVSASLARVSSLHSSISSLCVRPCSRAAKHEYHPDPQHEDRSSRIVLTDLDSRADEHTGRREAITRERPFRH